MISPDPEICPSMIEGRAITVWSAFVGVMMELSGLAVGCGDC
jgi:hypothetical protein